MKKIFVSLVLFLSIFISACGPTSSEPTSNDTPTISNPNTEPSVNPTTEPTIVPTVDPTTTPSNDPTSEGSTTSNEPTTKPHSHTFESKYTYDEEYHWHKSTCGHSDAEVKEKHEFNTEVTKPTYESKGYTTYTCTICNYSKVGDYTNVLEHKYESTYTYNETHHWYKCTDKGYENLKKGEEPHDFSSKVTAPTYEAGGYTTFTCKKCKYSYVGDKTNQLQHNYESTYTYNETHHWYKCTDKGYENLKKGEEPHSFNEVVIPSTHTEKGYTTYTCKACGYSYKDNYTDIIKYKIIYHLDGGENLFANPEGFTPEDEIYLMPAVKDGYGFSGWFDKNGNRIFGVPKGTTNDVDVYAQWVNVFTVSNGKLTDFDETVPILSASIPSTVHTIGKDVFSYANNIGMIEIPTSVTHIEEGAFDGYSSLEVACYRGTLDQWSNITFDSIDSTPMFCASSLYLLDSNRKYNEVTDIKLSENTTKINAYAFSEMENISTITIGANVTTIGTFAFKGNLAYTLNFAPGSKLVTIEDYAFSQCEYLTSVELPTGIKTIKSFAFDECSAISKLALPNTLTSIERAAFGSCQSLTTLEIPNTIKTITESCFNDCISLVSLTIPTSVTKIEGFAFASCVNLTELNIPNSCTSIGSYAFENCEKLYSIKIPSSVKTIELNAFEGCSSAITYCQASSKPSGWNSGWHPDYTPIYWNKSASDIIEINGCEYIVDGGSAILSSCLATTKNVVMEKTVSIKGTNYSVTAVGAYAFDCREITSVIISNSVKTVRENGFFCADVDWIVIPSSVTTIGDDAFNGLYFVNLFCEASAKPSSWPGNWCDSLTNVYWKDQWEYDSNNKPVVKK